MRDHCHYTGLYRGATHNNCNLKYLIPDYIPIVFHNLSGYDDHLFIKELGRRFNKNDIGVIAENKEKYISFNVKLMSSWPGLSIKMVKKCIKIFSLGLWTAVDLWHGRFIYLVQVGFNMISAKA